MIKPIALIFSVCVAALLLYAATRPDTFQLQRAISVKAPPDKLFALINDLHSWESWTPYNRDPTMKKTFLGAHSGPGAAYIWEGNSEVGQGRIDIVASSAPSRVELKLHMLKPFEAQNRVIFTILGSAEGVTQVVWAMDGPQNYLARLLGVFMSMDTLVGKDFEVGLGRLKAVAEK
jgi:hypothetical protein